MRRTLQIRTPVLGSLSSWPGQSAFAKALCSYCKPSDDDTTSPDPEYVSSYTASDCAVAGATAGTLDSVGDDGTVRFVLDSDKACSQCQIAHDNGPYKVSDLDESNTPALHPSCTCELVEVVA